MHKDELREFLLYKSEVYAKQSFVQDDPIQIPHRYSDPKDIEISGLISATLSWGNRKTIIQKADEIMERMDHSPYDFTRNAGKKELAQLDGFIHRTFQDQDIRGLVSAMQKLYSQYPSLGDFMKRNLGRNSQNLGPSFAAFKDFLLANGLPTRASKHFGDPRKGSACKRLIMYSRWMTRTNMEGIDFGLWDINPGLLSIPLDVHSGRVARSLGLVSRKANDWKTVLELDQGVRAILPEDPAKLDYALFGLGVYEGWK
jgi:uncharacterized protein (TIGR02757 family)